MNSFVGDTVFNLSAVNIYVQWMLANNISSFHWIHFINVSDAELGCDIISNFSYFSMQCRAMIGQKLELILGYSLTTVTYSTLYF